MDIKEEEKGKKWTYSRVFSSRCGLDRGCLTKVRRSGQRSGGFSSGTHRLYIDSSAHRQQGWERKKKKSGQKMSDTKVKVAVRVRPMNRRGKCVSTAMIFCVQNSHFPVSCSDSCYVIINFLISSPLLLPACVIRARSQPWAASQFWRKSGFFFSLVVFLLFTPPHWASLSQQTSSLQKLNWIQNVSWTWRTTRQSCTHHLPMEKERAGKQSWKHSQQSVCVCKHCSKH